MGNIVKTVRFPADDNVIKRFLSLQSNLTRSLQYLVMKHCREVGYENLQDLSEAYSQFKVENLYNMPCQALPSAKPEQHVMQKVSDNTKNVSNTETASTGIPSCYQ